VGLRRSGRAIGRAAAILAGALAAVALAAPAMEPDDSLLRKATLVARTDGWFGTRFRCTLGPLWISDTEVLHSRFTGRYDPNRLETRYNLRRTAYVLDTRTGRDARLPGLTRALAEMEPEIVDDEDVSPDGKWLLWSERWGRCLLASVKGTETRTCPEDDDGCYRWVRWLPDSRRWLEFFGCNGRAHHVLLHDVRRPKLAQHVPVAGREDALCSIKCVLSLDRAVGIMGPDRDLGLSEPNARAEVFRLGLLPPTPVRKVGVVSVPRGSPRSVPHLSPGGDRIAWEIVVRLPGSLCRTEAWVCRTDGAAMRLVGSVTSVSDSDTSSPPSLRLQWLPGGRRLSFEWQDRLYTVPVRG